MTNLRHYRVSFTWQGMQMWDYILAPNRNEACRMIEMRYPGATSFFITEEA